METNKSRVKNPTDTFIATLEASDINTNTQLFQRMLDDSTRYSKNLFLAAITYLSQQEAHENTLLIQLKACYDQKIKKAHASRVKRFSFYTTPETVFGFIKDSPAIKPSQPTRNTTRHTSQLHLSTIHEHYNETDQTNDALYLTLDHNNMYQVMLDMSEHPTQYQTYQLQQAIDDLNALPQSPRDSSSLRGRISTISTQRISPFTTDIIKSLKQALITGLSTTRDTINDSLTTHSPS